jgi:hypothetical protein
MWKLKQSRKETAMKKKHVQEAFDKNYHFFPSPRHPLKEKQQVQTITRAP